MDLRVGTGVGPDVDRTDGDCDGAGEGELLVFEVATLDVQTGDQDTTTASRIGLGAYEFSVEYDNFVI